MTLSHQAVHGPQSLACGTNHSVINKVNL